MGRRNISIPDDTEKRMSNYDFNWSRVAADAFTKTMDEHDMKTIATSEMDQIIARLKQEKQEVKGAWLTYGRDYAMRASYDELRLFEVEDHEDALMNAMDALESHYVTQKGQDFWIDFTTNIQVAVPTDEEREDFAIGMMEFWDEVKGKL